MFQVRLWTNSPDQFVEDEDDDSFSYSVRISAQDILLVRAFTSPFSSIFNTLSGKRLMLTNKKSKFYN